MIKFFLKKYFVILARRADVVFLEIDSQIISIPTVWIIIIIMQMEKNTWAVFIIFKDADFVPEISSLAVIGHVFLKICGRGAFKITDTARVLVFFRM